MGLFRSKKSARQIPQEPLPDWDDTRWRSHLRSNALGTDHHCGVYVEMISTDRKDAARFFKNDDQVRARSLAESSLRNNRIVTALAALSPLCNALYQRSEPLAGYTSLVQIPEPARSGIVTIIFAAGRLNMSYLSETVNFLREQFGTVHIDQIQKAQGDLYPLVNATVRDALSAVPASRIEIDNELASAVKQYFGISIQSSPQRSRNNAHTPSTDSAGQARHSPTQQQQQSDMRRATTTPISGMSADMTGPISPQLSQEGLQPAQRSTPQHERAMKTPSPPRASDAARNSSDSRGRMYASSSSAARYSGGQQGEYPVGVAERLGRPEGLAPSSDPAAMKRGRTTPVGASGTQEMAGGSRLAFSGVTGRTNVAERGEERQRNAEGPVDPEFRVLPPHLSAFKDSDELLLARYEHLREAISA